MSKKVEFQTQVEDAKHWEELLEAKKTLLLVDVYSAWCGPCKAIQSTLQRAVMDYGERGLKCLLACSDSIPALSSFAGRSRPLFQFYMDKQLVETVEGCNAPALLRAIEANLPGAGGNAEA